MGKFREKGGLGDLEKSLASGALLPVYLLVGEEQFMRHRARDMIRDVVVRGQGGTVVVLGADDPLEKVFEEVRGDSLFAARRMVELIQADVFLREHGDVLVRYLERPSASGVLVIDATKVDGRTRVLGAVRAAGMVVECPRLYESHLPPWVQAEVARRGRKISAAAVSLLVDEVGNNLFTLDSELEKLVTYVGERARIEAEDVTQLTGDTRSWVVWALTDALGRRDAASALRILERLLQEDSRAEGISGGLNWQVSRLWKGKYLLEKGAGANELASELRIEPRHVDAFVEQVRAFSREDLARVNRMLLDADITLKSSGLPEKVVLERFLVEACGVGS